MAIQNIALSAYRNQLDIAGKTQEKAGSSLLKKGAKADASFGASLKDSLKNVNEMQNKKSDMIEAFASGEKENVHELMITLQKAGLAMSMTSAVRNKVLESYKELMRLTF